MSDKAPEKDNGTKLVDYEVIERHRFDTVDR